MKKITKPSEMPEPMAEKIFDIWKLFTESPEMRESVLETFDEMIKNPPKPRAAEVAEILKANFLAVEKAGIVTEVKK